MTGESATWRNAVCLDCRERVRAVVGARGDRDASVGHPRDILDLYRYACSLYDRPGGRRHRHQRAAAWLDRQMDPDLGPAQERARRRKAQK